MHKLVIDSSSIISISNNCIIELIGRLSEKNFRFFLPQSVYSECVLRPLQIKRFELNAIRIKDAIGKGWLEVAERDPELEQLTNELFGITNCILASKGSCIKLIHFGEAESFALAKKLKARTVVIDERTSRMLSESPDRLKSFLALKHGKKLAMDRKKLGRFRDFMEGRKIIRSVEVLALAYELGCFEPTLEATKEALEAAMYAVRYAGCSVSSEEIKQYLREIR